MYTMDTVYRIRELYFGQGKNLAVLLTSDNVTL